MRSRREFRIFPIDTNNNKAVGVKLPFNSKGVFGLNYTTQEQVKTNLTNFMLTNPGERVFNVNYGAGLRDLVFNPQGDTTEIESRITDRIKAYFPQITLENLSFAKDLNAPYLYITLKYSFNRVGNELVISLEL